MTKPARLSRALTLTGLFVLMLSSLLAAGCGKSRFKALYPVKGRVVFEGKPAAGVTVLFSPLNVPDDEYVKPRGLTDDDGWFTLSTYKRQDGAPVGAYAVTLLWLPKGYAGPIEGGNKLPDRYRDPETSGFKVELVAAANELPPFELQK